jgi:hypothetical protein
MNRQNDSNRTKKGATSADGCSWEKSETEPLKGEWSTMESQQENGYQGRTLQPSPTAALESIMLTAVIDAHEERDVMTCGILNAFIQALMPEVRDGDE